MIKGRLTNPSPWIDAAHKASLLFAIDNLMMNTRTLIWRDMLSHHLTTRSKNTRQLCQRWSFHISNEPISTGSRGAMTCAGNCNIECLLTRSLWESVDSKGDVRQTQANRQSGSCIMSRHAYTHDDSDQSSCQKRTLRISWPQRCRADWWYSHKQMQLPSIEVVGEKRRKQSPSRRRCRVEQNLMLSSNLDIYNFCAGVKDLLPACRFQKFRYDFLILIIFDSWIFALVTILSTCVRTVTNCTCNTLRKTVRTPQWCRRYSIWWLELYTDCAFTAHHLCLQYSTFPRYTD